MDRATSDTTSTTGLTDQASIERRLAESESGLQETREALGRVRIELAELRQTIRELAGKQATTCKKCGTAYDLFSHHYSIGLFDNIVYVKCPTCQTAMPVDPHHGVRKD